jgi:predicted DNA-binding transcriptional regulator AlpA
MWPPKRTSFREGKRRDLLPFKSNGLQGQRRPPFFAPSDTFGDSYPLMKRLHTESTANREREESDRLLTASDVARITGLSTETLAQWRSQRRGIPFLKLARNVVRYRQSDLDKWLLARLVRMETEPTASGRGS